MKINVKKLKCEFLSGEGLDSYLDLVQFVKNGMEQPEWLGEISKENYINILNSGGCIRIFKYNDKLIAAGVLMPTTEKDLKKQLSADLDYREVIDYGPQMVHPDYVGNGIQMIIMEDLEAISKVKGFKHALCTVHPDNIFSINNIVKRGFIKIENANFKRGLRSIYRKEFK